MVFRLVIGQVPISNRDIQELGLLREVCCCWPDAAETPAKWQRFSEGRGERVRLKDADGVFQTPSCTKIVVNRSGQSS